MEALKKFIENNIDNVKEFLDIQHSLLKLYHKKTFYINTPKHVIITEMIENRKVEYDNILTTIYTSFNYEDDLLQEYKDHEIKYEFDNPHSGLNGKIKLFIYDLHQFVNSLDNTLPKCRNCTFDDNKKSFIGLIDPGCIEQLEFAIVKLEELMNRWGEILNEEKELLEKSVLLWYKYKYLIEQLC